MQHSKASIALAVALLCAGCDRQAALTATAPPAATSATAESSTTQSDPDAQCKSWGIQPGSPGYTQCVDAMTEAANAAAGTGGPQSAQQTQPEAATMRADVAQQADDLRKQFDDQLKAAASDTRCVTVTNGTNSSTGCP